MTNPLDPLLRASRESIQLTSEEKARYRASLIARMHATPLPQPSPFGALLSPWMRLAAIPLGILMLVSTGAAAASAQALPGEPLYAVKVRVIEPVRIALAWDPEDRAALQVELADTRLKELARVTVDGSLSPEAAEHVTSLLADHIEDAQQTILALGSDQRPAEALGAASKLQATLNAHADLLADADLLAQAPDTQVATVIELLDREAAETADLAEDVAAQVNASSDADLANPVEDQAAHIEREIEKLSGLIRNQENGTTRATGEALIAQARASIDAAARARAAGDYSTAAQLLFESEQRLTELRTQLEAGAQIFFTDYADE